MPCMLRVVLETLAIGEERPALQEFLLVDEFSELRYLFKPFHF